MIMDLSRNKFTAIGWLTLGKISFIDMMHPNYGRMVIYPYNNYFELVKCGSKPESWHIHPLELPWINRDLYVLTNRIKLKPLGSKTIYLVNGQWTHKKGP